MLWSLQAIDSLLDLDIHGGILARKHNAAGAPSPAHDSDGFDSIVVARRDTVTRRKVVVK
jgi:hypothetical protein